MWYYLPYEWEIAGPVAAGSFGTQNIFVSEKTLFFPNKIRAPCPDPFFLPYKVLQ